MGLRYSENIGRIAAAVERKYPGRGFIDIGANDGDTAAAVRANSNLPILCVEESEFYLDLLKAKDYVRQLDSILARHPRFQTSKILKIHTDGVDGRILLGALEWIRAARPVLFWGRDVGQDAAADDPGMHIFERLRDMGYQTAWLFDDTGDFIRTVSFEKQAQLDELSGYRDICAFHEEDLDLSACIGLLESENRRTAGNQESKQSTLPLEALRAHSQSELYRQQLHIMDLETRVSSKDAEIDRLHLMLRDLLAELHEERTIRNRNEELSKAQNEELKGQLTSAHGESDKLRHAMDTSLTLRAARSLEWILGPVRRLIGGNGSGGRP